MKHEIRKNYFIDKHFQAKYALLVVVLFLTYTVIFISVIFAPYILTLYLDAPFAEKVESSQAMLLLHEKIWPWIGGVILFFGVMSIFISHRIAGPLFRLKRSLSQVTQGDLNVVVQLRKWDELKDIADHVNILIEELRTFVMTLKDDYNLLSEYIEELERKIEAKTLTEESGREIINKVKQSRENIEKSLKKFNILQ